MAGSDRIRPLLFGAAALALYVLTLAPGVQWGDSAQLQYLTDTPRFSVGPRGYPLWIGASHLLYLLLPLTPAAAANLLSALCGAVAVALAWRLARRMTDSRCGADAAAATLAVSHLFWSSSVVAEVYSLSAVFVLLLLLLANRAESGERAPTFAFGFLAALCLLHHRTLLVVAAVLGLFLILGWLRSGRGLRPVVPALIGSLAGFAPWLLLVTLGAADGTFDLPNFLLGGFGLRLPRAGAIPGLLAYEASFSALNLAGPQAVLFLIGTIHAVRSRTAGRVALLAVLGAGFLLPLSFSTTGDRYVFLLPAFVAASVLAGVGATRLTGRWAGPALLVGLVVVPAAVYALLGHAVPFQRMGLFRGVDPRHTAAFFWPGRSGDRHAAEAGARIFAALPENSVVFCRWGEGQVLVYQQRVEGRRPDVTLRPLRTAPSGMALSAPAEGRTFVSAYPFFPPPPTDLTLGPPLIPGLLWPVLQP